MKESAGLTWTLEEDFQNSDRGSLATGVSGTLGANITPSFMEQFFMAEQGSSLSIPIHCQLSLEEDIRISDRGNLARDVSGTLGVNIRPFFFTVKFFLAEQESSLSTHRSLTE